MLPEERYEAGPVRPLPLVTGRDVRMGPGHSPHVLRRMDACGAGSGATITAGLRGMGLHDRLAKMARWDDPSPPRLPSFALAKGGSSSTRARPPPPVPGEDG